VGVNAGIAYVGNVGGTVMDFTALGDTVNVAARLQDRAAAGEVLLGGGAQSCCAGVFSGGEPRTLQVDGREEPVTVVAAHL